MTGRPRITALLWACLFALVGVAAVFHGVGANSWMTQLLQTGIPVMLFVLGAVGLWSSRSAQH